MEEKTAETETETTTTAISLPPLPENRLVVSCGMVFLDHVVIVDSFPKPDEKIRGRSLQVQGGGNAGNALTCAAHLGLKTRLITKVADDDRGKSILAELVADGIDASYVIISKGGTSPFTYVIVDNQTKTRTCIYTHGNPPMTPDEIPRSSLQSALHGARFVHLDGRMHKMAFVVAQQAAQMNIPILLDAEKSKTGLKSLLDVASYVICSEKFPEAWTSFSSMPRALISLVFQLPHVKFVIATLGEKGCIMVEKCTNVSEVDVEDVECVYESLRSKVDDSNVLPSCITSKDMMLSADGVGLVSGRLLLGTAETIPSSDLVDTTGAGDAFNGAILYALCAGMPSEKMLPFAARVAAANCKAIGARAGLPRRDDPCLAAFL